MNRFIDSTYIFFILCPRNWTFEYCIICLIRFIAKYKYIIISFGRPVKCSNSLKILTLFMFRFYLTETSDVHKIRKWTHERSRSFQILLFSIILHAAECKMKDRLGHHTPLIDTYNLNNTALILIIICLIIIIHLYGRMSISRYVLIRHVARIISIKGPNFFWSIAVDEQNKKSGQYREWMHNDRLLHWI